MKSLQKTAQETPKSTLLVVITALLGVATMFVDSAEILGISTGIVKWVSFGVSAFTFVVNTVINNLQE